MREQFFQSVSMTRKKDQSETGDKVFKNLESINCIKS